MNKIVKRTLIGSGILILLIGIFFVGYMLKAKSEIKKMVTIETGELAPNVFAIKDSFVNMFLIKDSLGYIAIDAGNDIDVVSEELKKLNINPEEILAVFLTHTDGDHVASLPLFKNADVIISQQEEDMINGKKQRFLLWGNSIGGREYRKMEDGQSLRFGSTSVKGILVPGHSPGSMCYQVNEIYLFTGDVMSLEAGKMAAFSSFFNMNTKMALQSMKTLTKIPGVKYIFTAHNGYSDDYQKAVNDWSYH
ncbi:MAG: MBL fold metallo-hydrolase [Bacteroidales bacterium]|nr:MBL fold metallo-hydrolase [Bacteroidales bacterium]